MKIYYKVKASNDDAANVGVIEAESKSEAKRKLTTLYGEQVEITPIEEGEFNRIEHDRGRELTHRPE